LPLHLIDRDVGITFKRASQRLGWWGRANLMGGLVAALFGDEDVGDDEIEKLKQGDMLEASFGEFAAGNPVLYEAVIAERDRYMAARLRDSATAASGAREVLAVVGAGHLRGLAQHLREGCESPAAASRVRTERRGTCMPSRKSSSRRSSTNASAHCSVN